MQVKRCSACLNDKPVSEFHKVNRNRGLRPSRGGLGVASVCKDCKANARRPGIVEGRKRKRELVLLGMKECGICKMVKAYDAFAVRRASIDGLSAKCRVCQKEYADQWRRDHPEAFVRWSADKKERLRSRYSDWREANHERRSEYMSKWAQSNRDLVRYKGARRAASKLNATVKWGNREAILAFYRVAVEKTEATGIPHEVDHIVPLQGANVCGLHWEGNLQVLTKVENLRKLNRMPEALCA